MIRFAALTLFILFSTTLRADIVVLRNGDRLHGEMHPALLGQIAASLKKKGLIAGLCG